MANPNRASHPEPPQAETIFSKSELKSLGAIYEQRAAAQEEIDKLTEEKEALTDRVRAILAKHDPEDVKSFRLNGYTTSYYTSWRLNSKKFREELLKRKVALKVIEDADRAAQVEDSKPTLRIVPVKSKNGDE